MKSKYLIIAGLFVVLVVLYFLYIGRGNDLNEANKFFNDKNSKLNNILTGLRDDIKSKNEKEKEFAIETARLNGEIAVKNAEIAKIRADFLSHDFVRSAEDLEDLAQCRHEYTILSEQYARSKTLITALEETNKLLENENFILKDRVDNLNLIVSDYIRIESVLTEKYDNCMQLNGEYKKALAKKKKKGLFKWIIETIAKIALGFGAGKIF